MNIEQIISEALKSGIEIAITRRREGYGEVNDLVVTISYNGEEISHDSISICDLVDD